MAKRLKVVRHVRKVVIPGSVVAFYDLFRGLPRAVLFYERLLGGEAGRLRESLDLVPRGTLLVADRGFSSVRLLAEMQARGVHGLIRVRSNMVARECADLGRHQDDGAEVRDRLVTVGEGRPVTPRSRVRLIEKKLPDGTWLRLATTVLDPAALPAADALALYRRRWAVERLFQDLKEVLNLRRFYAANTNAVAMQVYACAIVHAAMRVTQAQLAVRQELRPERLSTKKLFPRVAVAHLRLLDAIAGFEITRRANPRIRLVEPDWTAVGLYTVRLSRLLVVERKGVRRRPGYSPQRKLVVALHRYERRARPRGRDP